MEQTDRHPRPSRKTLPLEAKRKPLYRHITETLRDRILTGVWRADEALPSRRALAKELGTTHITVDKAVSQLVKEGLLSATIGSGTYVRRVDSPPTPSSIRSTRTRIGVVLGSVTFVPQDTTKALENYYFGDVLHGIRDGVIGTDIDVNYSRATLLTPESLRPGEFDGLILIAPSLFDIETIRHYSKRMKFVAVGTSSTMADGDELLPCVDSNNEQAAYEATRHLIDLGHRSIGYVNLSLHQANLFDRHRGVMRAMAEAGLSFAPEHLLLYPRWDPIAYPRLVEEWIGKLYRSSRLPTAIMTLDYDMTTTALACIDRHRIRVPDDVSLLGFDDRIQLEYHSPSITAVHQPIADLGRRAAERLIESIAMGGDDFIVGTELLPCSLIKRASTAAPRH